MADLTIRRKPVGSMIWVGGLLIIRFVACEALVRGVVEPVGMTRVALVFHQEVSARHLKICLAVIERSGTPARERGVARFTRQRKLVVNVIRICRRFEFLLVTAITVGIRSGKPGRVA